MLHSKTVVALAACCGLSAAGASAQDRAARFVERDANRDGVLSLAEYQSTGGHPGNFRALDTDRDGVLSRAEFVGRGSGVEDDAVPPTPPQSTVAPGATPQAQAFLVKDRNRDGVLTRAEHGDPATFNR